MYSATRANSPYRSYCAGAQYGATVITRMHITITSDKILKHWFLVPIFGLTMWTLTVSQLFGPQNLFTEPNITEITHRKIHIGAYWSPQSIQNIRPPFNFTTS